MRRRSNLLVLLGLASFVLGLLAVYLITGDDDGGGGGGDRVPVVVATDDIPAGSLGDDVVAAGQVEVIQVPAGDRLPDSLSSVSQLSGTRFTQLFPEDEQIRAGGIASLGGARAQIPDGFQAVALEVEFVAGGASTIIPNDRVNVFLLQTNPTLNVSNDDQGNVSVTGTGEQVKLLLTNVLVLDVQQGSPDLSISATPTEEATTNPNNLIVVVAVNTIDAEKVIFGAGNLDESTDAYRSLYLSRVPVDDEGNPPAPSSGDPEGRSAGNVLAEEAAAAFARSNP